MEAEDGPTPRLMPNTSFTGGDVAAAAPDLGLTSREAGAYLLCLQRLGLTEVAAVTAGAGPGTFQLTALMERLMNLICARRGGRRHEPGGRDRLGHGGREAVSRRLAGSQLPGGGAK